MLAVGVKVLKKKKLAKKTCLEDGILNGCREHSKMSNSLSTDLLFCLELVLTPRGIHRGWSWGEIKRFHFFLRLLRVHSRARARTASALAEKFLETKKLKGILKD